MNESEIRFWNKYYLVCRNLDKFLQKNIWKYLINLDALIPIADALVEAINPIVDFIEEFAELLIENVEFA